MTTSDLELAKQTLDAAVAQLYTEFAGYAHQHDMDFCPHCVSEEEVARLYARPLRELSADDLDRYAFKAMTTWGDTNDFRYFLPRLFELLIAPSALTLKTDPEIVVGKLHYGEWHTWPDNEQAAVSDFLKAWLRWRLFGEFTYAAPYRLSECVESIAQAEEDFRPYLAGWRNGFLQDRTVRLNTAAFLDYSQTNLFKGQLSWNANPVQAVQIINWLLEPDVKPLMEQTALEFMDATKDDRLTDILDGGVTALETLKMLYPQGAS